MSSSASKNVLAAVVRNSSDALTTSAAVGMQITISQDAVNGTAAHVESLKPTTNTNGMVCLEIS